MEKRIPKLILKYDEIKQNRLWGFQPTECYDCKGHLFYFAEELGIVYEKGDWQVVGYVFDEGKGSLNLRVVGIKGYCAECGNGMDSYTSWHYWKDDIVHVFSDGLDADEKPDIEAYLSLVNKTGKVEVSKKQRQIYSLYIHADVQDQLKKWLEKNKKLIKKKEVVKKKRH